MPERVKLDRLFSHLELISASVAAARDELADLYEAIGEEMPTSRVVEPGLQRRETLASEGAEA